MEGSPDNAKGGTRPHGPFAALSFAEQFLIWAARIWILAIARERRFPPLLQEGFCAAGVSEAAESLDALLWILCRHADRVPEFHAARCPCLGRDERMLIRAMAAAQKGEDLEIRKELETLLPAEMARAATPLLRDVGHVFLCAGLRFEALPCRSARPALRRSLVPLSRAVH